MNEAAIFDQLDCKDELSDAEEDIEKPDEDDDDVADDNPEVGHGTVVPKTSEEITGEKLESYEAYKLKIKAKMAKRTVIGKIKYIVRASQYVIKMVDDGSEGWCVQADTDTPEFYYESGKRQLSIEEYNWYAKRTTATGVLLEIHQDVKKNERQPFQLLSWAELDKSSQERTSHYIYFFHYYITYFCIV